MTYVTAQSMRHASRSSGGINELYDFSDARSPSDRRSLKTVRLTLKFFCTTGLCVKGKEPHDHFWVPNLGRCVESWALKDSPTQCWNCDHTLFASHTYKTLAKHEEHAEVIRTSTHTPERNEKWRAGMAIAREKRRLKA